jgi:hypothetical protein
VGGWPTTSSGSENGESVSNSLRAKPPIRRGKPWPTRKPPRNREPRGSLGRSLSPLGASNPPRAPLARHLGGGSPDAFRRPDFPSAEPKLGLRAMPRRQPSEPESPLGRLPCGSIRRSLLFSSLRSRRGSSGNVRTKAPSVKRLDYSVFASRASFSRARFGSHLQGIRADISRCLRPHDLPPPCPTPPTGGFAAHPELRPG